MKELQARFLLIRIPPAASAAVAMPILYVDQNDIPTVAGSIRQRFEFGVHPEDAPGYNPKVQWDGEHRLRNLLFEDSDADGVPELVEKNFWKETGTVTYFRFSKEKAFSPLWREKWRLIGDSYKLISKTHVKE